MKNNKAELKNTYLFYLKKLLYQKLTYFLSAAFIIASSVYFFVIQKFFTQTGSTSMNLFFSGIPYISILIVPALCSLIFLNKEEYDFPVRTMIISFAKVLAVSTVLAADLLLTVTVPVAVSFFGNVETINVIVSYFGMILFLTAITSLNVFITTMCGGQGSAFAFGTLLLAFVNSAHLLAMYFNLPEFIASFVKSISFAWHFDSFGKGIISSRELIFFITVSAFFVFASYFVMEKRRGKKSLIFSLCTLLTALIFAFILIDSDRLEFKIDATREKRFSLSSYSKELIKEIDEPFSITYYRSSSLKQLYPQVNDVRDFLELYKSYSKKIKLEVIDPSKNEEIARKINSYGIYSEQLETSGRDNTSFTNVYSAIVLEYLDKMEIIPFVLDTSSLEYSLTSRMNVMLRNTQKKIQVVFGNSLSENDYSYVIPWLESNGFFVTRTYLPSQNRMISFENFPEPLAVIGTSLFTAEDTEALENFILSGKKAFIATSAYEINLADDWSAVYVNDRVQRLLSSWGIVLDKSITADFSNYVLTMVSDSNADGSSAETKTQSVNYPMWISLQKQQFAPNGMISFWPSSIEYSLENNGYRLEPVLMTTEKAWNITEEDGYLNTNPFTVSKIPADRSMCSQKTIAVNAKGDLPGYYNTGKGTDCDVTVFADQYAFTTLMLSYTAGTNGDFRAFDFLTDRMLEISGNHELISIKNKNYVSNSIYKVSADKLSSLRIPVIIFTVMPGILLVCMLFVFICIKRKKAVYGYR